MSKGWRRAFGGREGEMREGSRTAVDAVFQRTGEGGDVSLRVSNWRGLKEKKSRRLDDRLSLGPGRMNTVSGTGEAWEWEWENGRGKWVWQREVTEVTATD